MEINKLKIERKRGRKRTERTLRLRSRTLVIQMKSCLNRGRTYGGCKMNSGMQTLANTA
jgi:hypothetical protein